MFNHLEHYEINESGNQKYFLQMNSFQDTATIDQESIIWRSFTVWIQKCFFVLNKIAETRGYGIYKQLKDTFEYSGLKVENITGASSDRWIRWCKKMEYRGMCVCGR